MKYDFNALPWLEWLEQSRLLHGRERRGMFSRPTQKQLRHAIALHAATIRQYGGQTGVTLYSCGRLLDIARGFYTLKNGETIFKTAAGE